MTVKVTVYYSMRYELARFRPSFLGECENFVNFHFISVEICDMLNICPVMPKIGRAHV